MNRFKLPIIITVCFFLIGLSVVTSIGSILVNKPSIMNLNGMILYVGGNNSGNYSSIQDAIDNASDGDTVFVYDDSSPYYENVIVRKSINLIGENRNTTVINGVNWLRPVVGLSYLTSNVLVSGFTITDSYTGLEGCTGIGIGGNNNIIQGNKITYNEKGILLAEDTYNNEIKNNLILHNSRVGIIDYCRGSTNTVTWNIIGGNGRESLIPYMEGGIVKHHSGGYFHHNDFDFNWGCNVYTEGSAWGFWDDGVEGNFWENWESNPGYPDVYIIPAWLEDQFDWHPSATRYFNHPIVRIKSSYEAEPGELIEFDADANKPSSSISWFWDFGDGNTSNEKEPVYTYSNSGIYNVSITITDNQGVTDTDKSIAYIGIPPDKPIITGPTNGRRYIDYEYSIISHDSDSDYITYYIDWGDWDGHIEYIGPVPSGEVITVLHGWGYINNYTVMVKAIDETLRESEWAYLMVSIPRNVVYYNSLFLRFLEQFPLLEKVLLYLIN